MMIIIALMEDEDKNNSRDDHDDDHDDKEDAADEEEEEEEDAIRYAICETAYDLRSIQYTHEKDYIPGICEMGFQTSVIQVSAHGKYVITS